VGDARAIIVFGAEFLAIWQGLAHRHCRLGVEVVTAMPSRAVKTTVKRVTVRALRTREHGSARNFSVNFADDVFALNEASGCDLSLHPPSLYTVELLLSRFELFAHRSPVGQAVTPTPRNDGYGSSEAEESHGHDCGDSRDKV
jgi:hypothetical protein